MQRDREWNRCFSSDIRSVCDNPPILKIFITLLPFLQLWLSGPPPSDNTLLYSHRELVSLIDRDGDGLLDKEELIAYQIRLTQHNDNQQTNRVFEKDDNNGDGVISLQELWSHGEDGE